MGLFDSGFPGSTPNPASSGPNLGIGTNTAVAPGNPNLGSNTTFGIPPISSLLGAIDSAPTAVSKPWDISNSNVVSPFFTYIPIDPTRWNQIFPYRLIVIDTSNNNTIVRGPSTNGFIAQYISQGTPIVSFEQINKYWEFSLPITPQQLNIVDQFAINTSATLRGIVEEHNGVKFKMISASGTMGVWPFRQNPNVPNQSPNILQSVFGGTISAATSLINQVTNTVNTFTTGYPVSKPKTPQPGDNPTPGINSTGYFQAMFLQQFLEQYAEAKKNPSNAGWRLVFDIPKQNTSYIVTPMQFTWRQDVNKPVEIQYQLQFKAWRRINLSEIPYPLPSTAYTITPGILQRVLNTITQAQLVASSAIALIGAVRSDVDGIFSIISQSALFVKGVLGVATAASDLRSSIVKDFNSAIQEWTFNNSQTALAGVTTAAGVAAVTAIVKSMSQNNGLTAASVQNGQLGNNAASLQQTNQVTTIFNNPNSNIDLLQQVPTNQLNLNTAQQNKLNSILSNTGLTVSQLQQNAATMQSLATQLADYFGAGSILYNSIYGITAPPPTIAQMTIDQFLILDVLYDFIQSMNILTATSQITNNEIQDSLDYVAGLANQSDIPFDVPTSKIIVPVPSNTSIEGIAARYLGDPNRWLEIVTLNQLQEPYIDYSGFQLPLVSNAIGRQVVITSDQNLYLGQTVTLMGAGQIQVSRHIISITALPNGQDYLLSLDGDPNLDNFTTAINSYLQCYLPGTVNAMQKIYIPSDLPPAQLQGQVNVPLPNIVANSGDPLAQISGIDFLLDSSGDLVIDQYGNFQLAYGMTNIIQWLYLLFSTALSSFLIHPEFGVGVSPGTSVADINIQDLYTQINNQITNDPRFAGVTSLQIQLTPPTLRISVGISIQGQSGIFPVSFELAAA